MKHKRRFIIGVDEVGRGPLAGPVAVGVVATTSRILKKFIAIKESKQLSSQKREVWVTEIEKHTGEELLIAVSMVSAKEIDHIGINPAIKKALAQSLKKLKLNPSVCTVFLDGGLKAPIEYKKQQTIIRGDASHTVIAMASVIAKVRRDTLMETFSKKYPNYGFATHKGYGTKKHMDAIRRHGLSGIHRKSFCSFLEGKK